MTRLDRRSALQILGGLPLVAACRSTPEQAPAPPAPAPSSRLPVIFAAHGAPMLLDDAQWMSELAAWAKAMPKPRAVLMVSAHWERSPIALGATRPVPLVYDFSGFPQRFYELDYAAPGAPELADRVTALLGSRPVTRSQRGLDHGAFVPMMAMYPQADVPVLQMSLPALDPQVLVEVGRALAPLRDEGILVFGSGFLTHNLAQRGGAVPPWASEFDAWSAEALTKFDIDALMDFRARAPGWKIALPTWEHYAPILVAAGAASASHPSTTFPITGWWMGPFTKRSVQFT